MSTYDTFTTNSITEARNHAASNPGHRIVEVDEESDGDIDVKTIELQEKDDVEEGGGGGGLFG